MNKEHGPAQRVADGYREMAASGILWEDTRAHSLIRADHADDFLRALEDPETMKNPPERFHDTQTGKHSVRFHWDGERLVGIEIVRIDGEAFRFSDLRDSSEFPISWLLQMDSEAMEDVPAPPSFNERIEEAKRRYKKGRSPLTADHLADVSLLYSKALHHHNPAPVNVVAAQFKVPKTTAANWIRKARETGFLPPTEGTKPKGYL